MKTPAHLIQHSTIVMKTSAPPIKHSNWQNRPIQVAVRLQQGPTKLGVGANKTLNAKEDAANLDKSKLQI